jgi:hypothetical protein
MSLETAIEGCSNACGGKGDDETDPKLLQTWEAMSDLQANEFDWFERGKRRIRN